jgi:hypothetical protein
MPRAVIFEWEGTDYAFEEKGADWYWALGIIATAAIIASVLFGNILLALVILAASISIGLIAARQPRIHRFTITDDGVAIDDTLYFFKDILSFSILEYIDPKLPPSLSLKTRHILAPHLLIPIVGYDPIEIYEYVAIHVDEGRHEESVFDRVVDFFRI